MNMKNHIALVGFQLLWMDNNMKYILADLKIQLGINVSGGIKVTHEIVFQFHFQEHGFIYDEQQYEPPWCSGKCAEIQVFGSGFESRAVGAHLAQLIIHPFRAGRQKGYLGIPGKASGVNSGYTCLMPQGGLLPTTGSRVTDSKMIAKAKRSYSGYVQTLPLL